jgi:hypothetical protein
LIYFLFFFFFFKKKSKKLTENEGLGESIIFFILSVGINI